MRKTNLVLLAILLLSITFVPMAEADVVETVSGRLIYTDTSALDIKLVRQSPYPAKPGEYVELLFKVENVGTEDAEDIKFELQPQYPFSLDEGTNATKDLGQIGGLMYGKDAYQVEYDVRVDEKAIGGENTIKVTHYEGDGEVKITEEFNISVAETRADLDATVGSLTEDILSLNVNNIGDEKAGSVTVEIPDQEGISLPGSSTKVIGNLSSGGNTKVQFPISSLDLGEHKVLIHYTDIQGTRRTVKDDITIEKIPVGAVEVVPEESSGGQVTLYVVNIGRNPIYSTIVKVPKQSGFVSQGPSSSVVGNLDAGDYAVTSFQGRGESLSVEVAYTDKLGVRRTVEKEVELRSGVAGNRSVGDMPRGLEPGQQLPNRPGGGASFTYVLIGLVGIVGTVVLVKYRGKLRELR